MASSPSASPEPPAVVAAVLQSEDFVPPSVDRDKIHAAESWTYHSPIPASLLEDKDAPCILGVDEAGRGPVLGPMVYAVAYCLKTDSSILKEHKFDDSKKLTAPFRASLYQTLSTPSTPLHQKLGWSTLSLTPRDISAGMLRASGAGSYNLNAQAHDTTIRLIQEVISSGVNVSEIYVDTVGPPGSYQTKLARLFPAAAVTVSKKADSIFPIVSAASVCAKVTRDLALEVSNHARVGAGEGEGGVGGSMGMGSGYPGDEKTKSWLRGAMDPVFGWDSRVVRFSWSTAKDLMEGKGRKGEEVEWAEEREEGERGIEGFFSTDEEGIGGWYGKCVQADF